MFFPPPRRLNRPETMVGLWPNEKKPGVFFAGGGLLFFLLENEPWPSGQG
jgi:hypothetical protein